MTVQPYERNIVLGYSDSGFSSTEIARKLCVNHSVSLTSRGVRKIIQKNKEGSTTRKERPRKAEPKHFNFINYVYNHDSSVTAKSVQSKLLDVFNLKLSISRIKCLRRKLGWTSTKTGYCQLISKKNQIIRKEWCLKMLESRESFNDVIFVDETTIEMCSSGKLVFRQKDSATIDRLPGKAAKPKHSYKVHMWGGISYRGVTGYCLFNGVMDSVIYQGILGAHLLPFTSARFPDGFRLYQDNDAKHVSRSTTAWMEENGVEAMKVPASSPDINPVENVWAELKHHLKTVVKPKKKDELLDGIENIWRNLTPDMCGRYIDHIHKVVPTVVINNGAPTEF